MHIYVDITILSISKSIRIIMHFIFLAHTHTLELQLFLDELIKNGNDYIYIYIYIYIYYMYNMYAYMMVLCICNVHIIWCNWCCFVVDNSVFMFWCFAVFLCFVNNRFCILEDCSYCWCFRNKVLLMLLIFNILIGVSCCFCSW